MSAPKDNEMGLKEVENWVQQNQQNKVSFVRVKAGGRIQSMWKKQISNRPRLVEQKRAPREQLGVAIV